MYDRLPAALAQRGAAPLAAGAGVPVAARSTCSSPRSARRSAAASRIAAIDAGNLVSTADAGGGTLLTTINALDPIYFTFDVPEALYLKAARERQAGGGAARQAEIRLQDESDYS